MHRRPHQLALALATTAALAACSLGGGDAQSPKAGATTPSGSDAPRCTDTTEVVVATHDSFSLPDETLQEFTARTGCVAKVLQNGDAGQVTNKLVLTKGSPIADAVFGIDNTFASRAVTEGVLAPYTPAQLPRGAADHAPEGAAADVLTPVDFGDVCVNIDTQWFPQHSTPAPASLDDLTKPEYKDLFVTPGATTSSPGLAFLLATIGAYGTDGWQDYWRSLMANGAKLTSGWSDAYGVDFTAGEGNGTRPIVLSYATSPPYTIPEGGTEPTTAALLDTCFRQVEYAGVVAGAKNPEGAKAFVDFLLSDEVQAQIPEAMYVFPVSTEVALPAEWSQWAEVAPKPYTVPADEIEQNRDEWLTQWSDITGS